MGERVRRLTFCLASLFAMPMYAHSCDPVLRRFDRAANEIVWPISVVPGIDAWGRVAVQFGRQNAEVIALKDEPFEHALRVRYPAGSYDPGSAAAGRSPEGGVQFTARPSGDESSLGDVAILTYAVRFSENFGFVRGGKLPGFFGGIPRSGGRIPNGRDGFSTRMVWQEDGDGAVYAYLPTSVTWGTLFGKGNWRFRPGKWIEVAQQVKLNSPGRTDGSIAIWVDRELVVNVCGLRFRDVETLQIDGIFFSTFFGGNDRSWATPDDVHVDFADFSVLIPRASKHGASKKNW